MDYVRATVDKAKSLPDTNADVLRQAETSFQQRWLIAILVIALALRLIYVLALNPAVAYQNTGGDNIWYLANGYALFTGFDEGELKGYGDTPYPISQRNLPTPPLFLLFLGIWQAILPREAAIVALRIVQAIMGAATCYFAYRLASAVAGDTRAGLVTAGVLAVSPAFVLETGQIATETIYIFFITGALWIYVKNIESRGSPGEWTRLMVAGVVLGLATLTRAVALLFPLGLVLHLLMVYGLRAGLKRAALLLVVYALVVSTWTIYSYARWNRLVIAGEGFAAFLYIGALESGWQGPSAVDQSLGGNLPPNNDDQQELYRNGAQSIISGDPVGYIRRRVGELVSSYAQPHGTVLFSGESLRDLALNWLRNDRTPGGLVNLTRGEAFWPKLSLYIFHYAGLIGGLAGMWISRKQWRVALPLIGFIAYTTLIHLVLSSLPRYLFPTQVFWWVFAGAALVSLAQHLKSRQVAA